MLSSPSLAPHSKAVQAHQPLRLTGLLAGAHHGALGICHHLVGCCCCWVGGVESGRAVGGCTALPTLHSIHPTTKAANTMVRHDEGVRMPAYKKGGKMGGEPEGLEAWTAFACCRRRRSPPLLRHPLNRHSPHRIVRPW